MTFISRRDLLKRVGAAAVVVPAAGAFETSEHVSSVARDLQVIGRRAAESVAQQSGGPLESFTATEAELMDAIVARLIPTDEHGPGATEAHAVRYIDRALGGALAASRQAYATGLAALDRYAHSSRGGAFTRLSATDQDSVLIDVETGAATGFAGGSAAFFGMVLGHTHQGTFGDPYYGGNANFVGWDLLAYPGVRTMVTSTDQKALETHQLKPNHRSAYDYEPFTKASHDHEA